MRKRICGICFSTLISLSVLGVPRFVNVEMQDTSYRQLNELHVTSSKENVNIESSVPVQKIDASAIMNSGITDIADAMNRMAGVNLRDYGGAGGMKTVSVRGLGTQHTGVVYDGAPVSDMQTGQIDLSRFPLENINAITLNIGDGDDIFSFARTMSSAANLSINTLLSPDLLSPLPQLSAKFRFASFSTLNPYLRFSKSNGHNLAFAVTADFLHSLNNYPFKIYNDNLITKERRQNSLINSGHAETNLIWKPLPSQTLRFKAYYYFNFRHLPGPIIYYAAPSNETLHEKNAFGQIDYKATISSKLSLKTITKFNWSTSRYRDINGKYPGGELDDYYLQSEEYIAATLLYRPIEDLRFSYALDYYHNHLSDNDPDNSHPSRDSFLQSLAGNYKFWRLNITARTLWSMIWDNTTLQGKMFNSKFSPSLSFSVQPFENINWNVRISYKNIFRMPTFNELYFEHYGSINLEPEITDQFNLGMTYLTSASGFLKSFEVTIDGYMNHIKNKIVAIPYNTFIWTMSNMGKVRSLGLDVTLSMDFTIGRSHNLLLNANYSYQRAAPRTDRNYPDWQKQLPYTPLNSGSWSLTWLNPWVNFVIHSYGCSSRYSTSTNISTTKMPGYMEFGFSLYREFKYRKCTFEIKADVINAFNKQYEIVRRYPMPGRSFSLTLGFKLN